MAENENENTLKYISITLAQMNVTLKNVEHRLTKVEKSLTKLEILEGRVIEIESSQQFLSTKYDELNNKSTYIDKENKQIDKENKLLLSKINSLEKKLEEERHKRISLEQYGRREMLEISGIQKQEGEGCIEIAHHICKTAKANIPIHKIEIAHRIMNGSIIVKFRDRSSRDLLFKNKLQLKNVTSEEIGYEGPPKAIYINESLAFDTRKLLCEVKTKCREIGYKRVITDNGIIKIKKDQNSKDSITINNTVDLD